MPLVLVENNQKIKVKSVGGKSSTRRHLESLGISAGVDVVVISRLHSSLIVSIKGVKVAIDENSKIFIKQHL